MRRLRGFMFLKRTYTLCGLSRPVPHGASWSLSDCTAQRLKDSWSLSDCMAQCLKAHREAFQRRGDTVSTIIRLVLISFQRRGRNQQRAESAQRHAWRCWKQRSKSTTIIMFVIGENRLLYPKVIHKNNIYIRIKIVFQKRQFQIFSICRTSILIVCSLDAAALSYSAIDTQQLIQVDTNQYIFFSTISTSQQLEITKCILIVY